MAWKKLPRVREEYYDYNERVITEVLVNALIHRMYDIMGAEIHIDIYDDRLEIESPGGMYDGGAVQNEDILNIPSKRRNPVIADVFQRLGFMERRGSGFKKIYSAFNGDMTKIKFYSDINDFKVILYNENYNRKTTGDKPPITADKISINSWDLENVIIEYLQKNEYITNKIVKEKFDIKDTKSKVTLRKLVSENILISEGANRNRRYKLNKKFK